MVEQGIFKNKWNRQTREKYKCFAPVWHVCLGECEVVAPKESTGANIG